MLLVHFCPDYEPELPSTAWPCRLRHVEGQTVPELQFDAKPFLAALKKLQDHQYGQKMKSYQPPQTDMLASLLSDAPPEPSEEEVKLRMTHLQWMDLHVATRENLLKFEDPSFELSRAASGEEAVKKLVIWVTLCVNTTALILASSWGN
jgi:hypothetical protein